MVHPLDEPMPRRNQDIEKRLQESFSIERKNLIKEAERVYINTTGKKPKKTVSLGDLIDDAIRKWIKEQEGKQK